MVNPIPPVWKWLAVCGDKFIHQSGYLAFFCMAPGLLFRIEQSVVYHYFKPPAIGRDQGDGLDLRFELVEKFSRQTGGSVSIVSDRAVFDRNFHQHGAAPGLD